MLVRSFDDELPHEYRFGDFNPERIILNDPVARDSGEEPLPADAQVGDRFAGPIDAIVDYSFGNYKFLAREVPALEDGGLRPQEAPAADKNELSVASYNVENLDPVNDAARLRRIAGQIVRNLKAPDILGVQEMQDFDGEGPGGPAGEATFAALVQAIADEGGPAYEFRQIDPVHNQDGGAPNANIRVGFLFRPDRVSFVDRPGGTAVNGTEDDPAQPGRAAHVQPRQDRAERPGLGGQPEAARGRVPLPRPQGVRRGEPLRVQGRRRAPVRALPGALPAERAAAARRRRAL